MTVRVKQNNDLVVPASVQRRAGIRAGDQVEFKVTAKTITITAKRDRTHKPNLTELAAIRKGESQLARGECVSLPEFLNELDRSRRKAGAKVGRKVSR